MSYSTDPVEDEARYFEKLAKINDLQAAAEREAFDAYIRACQKCDANAIAIFAPRQKDWSAPRIAGSQPPMRMQHLHEVMAESFGYESGPSMREAMQLLLNVAYGTDLVNAPAQARDLIKLMDSAWVGQNINVEEV